MREAGGRHICWKAGRFQAGGVGTVQLPPRGSCRWKQEGDLSLFLAQSLDRPGAVRSEGWLLPSPRPQRMTSRRRN